MRWRESWNQHKLVTRSAVLQDVANWRGVGLFAMRQQHAQLRSAECESKAKSSVQQVAVYC